MLNDGGYIHIGVPNGKSVACNRSLPSTPYAGAMSLRSSPK